MFVWALILGYFLVPLKYQHRVLFWGIFGALMLRAIVHLRRRRADRALRLDAVRLRRVPALHRGQADVRRRRARRSGNEPKFLKVVHRFVPSTDESTARSCSPRVDGKRLATPLFAVLVLVEATDVVFAVDSVPAVLAVSHEQFIVFASNAFAILGLRALYFLLADMHARFRYLQQGLAVILAFVGVKMIIAEWYHIPTWLSLLVIVIVLAASIGVLAAGHRTRTTIAGEAFRERRRRTRPTLPTSGDARPVASTRPWRSSTRTSSGCARRCRSSTSIQQYVALQARRAQLGRAVPVPRRATPLVQRPRGDRPLQVLRLRRGRRRVHVRAGDRARRLRRRRRAAGRPRPASSSRYTTGGESKDRQRRKQLVEAMAHGGRVVPPAAARPAPTRAPARDYLRSRGLAGDVARQFKLGWAPDDWDALSRELGARRPMCCATPAWPSPTRRNRLQDSFRARVMFPIFTENGEPVAFGGRILPGSTDPAKYKNSPETRDLHASRRRCTG